MVEVQLGHGWGTVGIVWEKLGHSWDCLGKLGHSWDCLGKLGHI